MARRFEPEGLPRQRRGTAPQAVGRYPDFDVLDTAGHWDAATRRVVLDRVERVPELRFFDEEEQSTLVPLCDRLTAQDREPRIPVLNYIDEKLASGVARRLPLLRPARRRRDLAHGRPRPRRRGGRTWRGTFGRLGVEEQRELCHRFSRAQLTGPVWGTLNVGRAYGVVIRYVCEAFYSHPWAWNEIGFPGPAYPRGYTRFGSPHLRGGETEAWEAEESFQLDAARDVDDRELP